MQTPFGSTGPKPEEAFAGAAERFFELLRTFGLPPGAKAPDWSSLTSPLAREFEQWLRLSQSAAPWFAAVAGSAGAGSPAAGSAGAPFTAPSQWPFGGLPLGALAAEGGDTQRIIELLGRLAQLQAQLATHWSEIAQTAARRFVTRLGGAAAAPATPDQALELYETWVGCAEEAYAATVHREEFGRLQAELANTWAALLVEQRRHAETLVRAFGLPSRGEVDALKAQVQELRRELADLADQPRSSGRGRKESAGQRRRARQVRAPSAQRAKRSPRRPSGKRARTRRPRR